MKIIYFSHSDIFSKKANVVHVLNMCSAFIKLGHQVKLYVWKNKKYKLVKKNYDKILDEYNLSNNIEVCNYPNISSFGNSFISSLYLSKTLNLKDVDFIIGRNLRACFFLSNKIPIFYETHQPYNLYNFLDRFLFKKLIKSKKFNSLITISDYLINDYSKIFNFKDVKKLKLRDGSNTNENITPTKQFSKPSAGYIGSLYKGRGIEIILKLSNIMKDISFHIVGGSNQEVEYFKKNFSNNNNNLIFHGYVNYKSSLRLMKSFDLLLAPYQSNTIVPGGVNTSKWMSPIKLFEYMASKKPIITSDMKSLKEFMTDRHNCLLIKDDQINEWKNAINLIVNDTDLSKKISHNAFNDLKYKYTWNIRVNKIIKNFINI